MDAQLTRISKFLSLILRHNPDKIGLQLDQAGWADVRELLTKAAHHGVIFDETTLHEVVANNSKQRFALSDDGQRIRANQGHSIDVDLELVPQTPPAVLYHGTATRFVSSIQEAGLQSQARQHVHLSQDTATAINVGQRHGKPVVLLIDAAQMHADGLLFYCSANGVWLTEHVPTRYITFPS